jgi:undecaprenyl-diphosphatase
MTLFEALCLAVVEGLTEYLPVSSTGHIILTSALFGIQDQLFTKNFTVIVQFGAILAVLVIYFERFWSSVDFYRRLVIAFLPAVAIGFLLKDVIDHVLGSVEVVATALIAGGVVLVVIERWMPFQEKKTLEAMTWQDALIIGLCQCAAFIPGVSRSAASILGGLWRGYDRVAAAEFSFFLAVPTLTAATVLKTWTVLPTMTGDQMLFIAAGNVVSFITGYVAIKYFIQFLSRHSLAVFGWYRIALGSIIWMIIASGHTLRII